MGKFAEYACWMLIKARCFCPTNPAYSYYGGRGITMYEPWRRDFFAFRNFVGPRPSSKHTIDRIDNDGNYEPGNVRWATRKEQARNRRSNVYLELDGRRLIVEDWASLTGIKKSTIVIRIKKYGWSVQRALTVLPSREAA
jgi:hypothetical protein